MPLETWVCDECGDEISEVSEGTVIWKSDAQDEHRAYDFRIVHKNLGAAREGCDPGNKAGYQSNLDIAEFIGDGGVAHLLAFLSIGPLRQPSGDGYFPRVKDLDEFVDLFRRLQTPWYEEARRRFDDQEVQYRLSDANEVYPYLPVTLERVAKGERGGF